MFLGLTRGTFAQDPQQPSNYVVIGAFAKLGNAVRFTDAANLENFQAQYAINSPRNLYYVFILNVSERSKAYSFLLKIREETTYKDAWLYTGKLGLETDVSIKESEPTLINTGNSNNPAISETVVEELPKNFSPAVVAVDSSTYKKPVEEYIEEKPIGKPFYFKLINSESRKEVLGEVHVMESKSPQFQRFNGNELVYLIPPKNNTGIYLLTIQVPGYKTAKLAFDYKDPSAVSSGAGERQEAIVIFELVRAKKGDYVDFNNVRFLHNTSILESMSQKELDEMVTLMMEDLKYKIRIHGHCNGDESREIITMGSSTDFFRLDASKNTRETTTAKGLSEFRAEAVKDYFISKGIDKARIVTKGEGGKMMIYPKTSTLAIHNDRVEIEVLKSGK